MKRFLRTICCFLFLLLLLALTGLFALPNKAAWTSLLGVIPKKMQTAQSMPSPKILLAGGSNVSFGMLSDVISEELGMPVMNMGVHASLGLAYILSQSMRLAQQHDIIVFLPEYDQLYDRNTFLGANQTLVSTLCDIDPAGLKYLSPSQWCALSGQFASYAKLKWMNPRVWWTSSQSVCFSSASFNELGDQIAYTSIPSTGFGEIKPWSSNATLDARTAREIARFVEKMKVRGVQCFFLPPVHPQSGFNINGESILRIEHAMRANGTPFLVPCTRYQFDDDEFFDTIYHLAYRSAHERSKRVAEDVKRILNHDAAPVDTPIK